MRRIGCLLTIVVICQLSACAKRVTPKVFTGPGYQYTQLSDGRYAMTGNVEAAMKAIGCGVCSKQELRITLVKKLPQ